MLCSKCGFKNNAIAGFCEQCGKPLTGPTHIPAPNNPASQYYTETGMPGQPQQTGNRKVKTGILIGGIVLCVLVLGLLIIAISHEVMDVIDRANQRVNAFGHVTQTPNRDSAVFAETYDVQQTPMATLYEGDITDHMQIDPYSGIVSLPGTEIIPGNPSNEVLSVIITYNGRLVTEFSARAGEVVPLRVRVEPPDIKSIINWESSDLSIIDVKPTNTDSTSVDIKALGVGIATLTVTVGNVSQDVIITVR